MTRKYDRLDVCVLTHSQHLQTCNYWFVVTSGCSPHTAFTTKQGLERWLSERGLKLTALLTEPGTHSWQRIHGEYATECHFRPDSIVEWFKLKPVIVSRTLSNGDWVEAKITEKDGLRTVHTLNPNVRNRRVFDYQESLKMMQ